MKAASSPGDIAFRTLFHTYSSAIREFSLNVARDQEGWDELWPVINTSRQPPPSYYELALDEPKPPVSTWTVPPTPHVDWSTGMVIVVGIGTRGSGGFDVRIRRLSMDGPVLEAYAVETRPSLGSCTTQLVMHPAHAVTTARYDGKVRLILDVETRRHADPPLLR